MKLYKEVLIVFTILAASAEISLGAVPNLGCPECCPQTEDQISDKPEIIGTKTPTGNEIWSSSTSHGVLAGCGEDQYRITETISEREYTAEYGLYYIAYCNGEEEGCDKMETYSVSGGDRTFYEHVPGHTRPHRDSGCLDDDTMIA